MKTILLLNGPNLNLLGTREPEVYGNQSLADIEAELTIQAAREGFDLKCIQTNVEGELVNSLQEYGFSSNGIILNPGGYTHTSVAIRDAISAIPCPVVEVHISHPEARESFRKHSMIREVCVGAISGLGIMGYEMALRFFMDRK